MKKITVNLSKDGMNKAYTYFVNLQNALTSKDFMEFIAEKAKREERREFHENNHDCCRHSAGAFYRNQPVCCCGKCPEAAQVSGQISGNSATCAGDGFWDV